MPPVQFTLDVDEWSDLARKFHNAITDIPEWETELLRQIANFMRSTLFSTYVLDLPLGGGSDHRLPTHYQGSYGNSIQTSFSPTGTASAWVFLQVTAPHAQFIEVGRAGGAPIDEVEKERIKEWAEIKLGVTSKREIRNILRAIQAGVPARRLLNDAFAPGTPRGDMLLQQVNDILRPALARLLQRNGI